MTLKDGVLYSIKRVPSKNIATKSLGRFFSASITTDPQAQLAQEDRGIIKGKNEIARLFKIDVVGKGRNIMSGMQSELELILHFVNKEMDPTGKAEMRRYLMKQEQSTTTFLA